MHEYSIADHAADEIIKNALETKAKRILKAEIVVGELSEVGVEQFAFWIKEILNSRIDIAKDAEIEVSVQKGSNECILNRIEIEG